MNTLSILVICGFIYLLFVTWMFGKKNDAGQGPTEEVNRSDSGGDSSAVEPHDAMPLVPKSDFSMEAFKKAMTESMTAAMTYVLNTRVGDVTPEQVEFTGADIETTDSSDVTSDRGKESAAESVPDINEIEPDINEIEPDSVSPPATGNSLDEIESALNTAANKKASSDDKAEAGMVLAGMRDVVFIGKIMTSDDRINEGIMSCVAESMKRQKPKKKGSPAPKKKNGPIDVGVTLRDIDMIKRRKEDEED